MKILCSCPVIIESETDGCITNTAFRQFNSPSNLCAIIQFPCLVVRNRTSHEFPFFSPVLRKMRALPPNTAILAICKNFLYFTSKCVTGTIFLSTIQAGSQSIEIRWTDSLYGCRLHLLQASEKNYSTSKKHLSSVFIEVVQCVLQSRDKLIHVIKCWTGGNAAGSFFSEQKRLIRLC